MTHRLLVLVFAPVALLLGLFNLVDAHPSGVFKIVLLATVGVLAFLAMLVDWHLDYAEAELERLQRQQDRQRKVAYHG